MKRSEKKPDSSSDNDDSLADFKSPKIERVAEVSNKLKIINEKRAKKSSITKKNQSTKKKEGNSSRLTSNAKDQPCIESSFFKANIKASKDGHTCPLCMKYFAEVSLGIAHSKSCATKNNVSTKKLLAAVALQERQADERLAIGLPAGPFVQSKNKAPKKYRDPLSNVDPDLQLAIALSESLQETEMEKELEEAILLTSEHTGEDPNIDMTNSQRRQTLKNYGFSSNKPVSVGINVGNAPRSRKRKHLGPTILQTRSQESRERLLTIKIAEILMGNEPLTQAALKTKNEQVKKLETILRSRLLKSIHQPGKRLWTSAQLSPEISDFYVKNLEPVVAPLDDTSGNEKKGNEENLLSLNEDQEKIEKLSKHSESTKEKGNEENLLSLNEDQEKMEKLSKHNESAREEICSYSLEKNSKMINERTTTVDENCKEESRDDNYKNSVTDADLSRNVCDREYRNTLSTDWSNLLNVRSMSDVVLIVKNNKIWAHKLVLYVRCPKILSEIKSNESNTNFSDTAKEKIYWPAIDFSTALAFLEFVYSGVIDKNKSIFEDEGRMTNGVKELAKKYNLKSLMIYLRKKRDEIRIRKKLNESSARTSIIAEVEEIDDGPNIFDRGEKISNDEDKRKTHNSFVLHEKKEEQKEKMLKNKEYCDGVNDKCNKFVKDHSNEPEMDSISLRSTPSPQSESSKYPDLFGESMDVEKIDKSDRSLIKNPEKILSNLDDSVDEMQNSGEDNSNLKILAQLVADEMSSDESERSTISKSQLENANSSESFFSDSKNEENNKTRNSPMKNYTSISLESRQIKSKSLSVSQCNIDLKMTPLKGKLKSDLSIFIEKVQKINALPPEQSYSDAEFEADSMTRRRFRNPFNINNDSNPFKKDLKSAKDPDSSNYSTCDEALDEIEEVDEIKISKNNHKKIDLSNDIELEKLEELSTDEEHSLHDSIDLKNKNIDEYQNSSRNLNLGRENIDSAKHLLQKSIFKNSLEKENSISDKNLPNYSKLEDVDDLSTEEEDNEEEISMYSKYKKTNKNENSILRYRKMLEEAKKSASEEINSIEEPKIDSMETAAIDLTQESDDEIPENDPGSQIERSIKSKETENKKCMDYSDVDMFEVDEDIFENSFNSQINTRVSPLHLSSKEEQDHPSKEDETCSKNKSYTNSQSFNNKNAQISDDLKISLNSFEFENFKEVDANELSDSSVSTPKIQSSPKSREILTQRLPNEKDQRANSLSPSSSRSTLILRTSPIVISSSPDIESNHGISQPLWNDELGLNAENIFSPQREMDRSRFQRQELDLDRFSPSPSDQLKSPYHSPITNSPDFFRSQIQTVEFNESPDSVSIRKLKARSISMPVNTSRHDAREDTRSSTSKLHQKSQESPPNYDVMDTPELRKELDKFGIKPQKRKRARQLLNHIYEQLRQNTSTENLQRHSENDDIESEEDDEERPAKRRSNADENSRTRNDVQASSGNEISKDTETKKVTVKDAFSALLEADKDLHTKVLTYQPLSFEALHTTLKAQGCKCKQNELMDFLDEQCITFQTAATSKNRTKKSKPKGSARGNEKKSKSSERLNPN